MNRRRAILAAGGVVAGGAAVGAVSLDETDPETSSDTSPSNQPPAEEPPTDTPAETTPPENQAPIQEPSIEEPPGDGETLADPDENKQGDGGDNEASEDDDSEDSDDIRGGSRGRSSPESGVTGSSNPAANRNQPTLFRLGDRSRHRTGIADQSTAHSSTNLSRER